MHSRILVPDRLYLRLQRWPQSQRGPCRRHGDHRAESPCRVRRAGPECIRPTRSKRKYRGHGAPATPEPEWICRQTGDDRSRRCRGHHHLRGLGRGPLHRAGGKFSAGRKLRRHPASAGGKRRHGHRPLCRPDPGGGAHASGSFQGDRHATEPACCRTAGRRIDSRTSFRQRQRSRGRELTHAHQHRSGWPASARRDHARRVARAAPLTRPSSRSSVGTGPCRRC